MVRNFKSSDIEKIMEIWLEANLSAHSFIAQDYWQQNYAQVQDLILGAEIYVYEQDGKVVAFVGLDRDYIAGIFVKEQYQSLGMGTKLLNHIKLPRNQLFLNVYKQNQKAVKFYRLAGFMITSELLDIDTSELELRMKWTRINE